MRKKSCSRRGPNPRQPHDKRPGQQPGEQPKPGEQPNPANSPNRARSPSCRHNPSEELDKAVHAPVPEELKKQFEARTGYANFYFNRENTQRVWKALTCPKRFCQGHGKLDDYRAANCRGPIVRITTCPGAADSRADQHSFRRCRM